MAHQRSCIGRAKDKRSEHISFYFSLSGLSPFLGDDDNETLNNILSCSWDFEDEEFRGVSDQAKDFISKLLIKEKWYIISISLKCVFHAIMSQLRHVCCSIAELSGLIKVFYVHIEYHNVTSLMLFIASIKYSEVT